MDPRAFRQWSPPTRMGAKVFAGDLAKAEESAPKSPGAGRSVIASPSPGLQVLSAPKSASATPKITTPGPKPNPTAKVLGPQGQHVSTAMVPSTPRGMAQAKPKTMGGEGGGARPQMPTMGPSDLRGAGFGGGPQPKQLTPGSQMVVHPSRGGGASTAMTGGSGSPPPPHSGAETTHAPATPTKTPTGTGDSGTKPPEGKPEEKAKPEDAGYKGPNILGAYQFGHRIGSATVTPTGPAQLANIYTGRAVSEVHGLLNRKTPHHYEGQRLQREAELTRRTMERRTAGEGGGVVTQSSMKSLHEAAQSLQIAMIKSGVRRPGNGK